jgi:hypothetical protein
MLWMLAGKNCSFFVAARLSMARTIDLASSRTYATFSHNHISRSGKFARTG